MHKRKLKEINSKVIIFQWGTWTFTKYTSIQTYSEYLNSSPERSPFKILLSKPKQYFQSKFVMHAWHFNPLSRYRIAYSRHDKVLASLKTIPKYHSLKICSHSNDLVFRFINSPFEFIWDLKLTSKELSISSVCNRMKSFCLVN